MTNLHSRHGRRVSALMFLSLAAAGCEYTTSRNPLTPVPATPGTGVESAPQVPRVACVSDNPEAVVACVSATYPQHGVSGVSGHEREENMAFLRDRIIEAGICGGLDLAWNLKRSVGPRSIDALAWRTPTGHVEVVDIGIAYDDPGHPLHLQWAIVAGPSGYDTYQPRPHCG